MSYFNEADGLIDKPRGIDRIIHKDGDTDDIIDTIMWADQQPEMDSTKEFAKANFGVDTYDDFRQLWKFTRHEIKYKRDKLGYEVIKSPAETWFSGFADCKSKSLFVASILRSLGIKYKYRFAGYVGDEKVTHVYVLAKTKLGWIIIDPVYKYFDQEDAYKFKLDFDPRKKALMDGVGAIPTSTKKNMKAAQVFFGVASLALLFKAIL